MGIRWAGHVVFVGSNEKCSDPMQFQLEKLMESNDTRDLEVDAGIKLALKWKVQMLKM
jgi:hypothetical protein